MNYPYAAEARGLVEAPAEVVFAFLDDQENLSGHMSKPSGMMLGSTIKIVMEPDHAKRRVAVRIQRSHPRGSAGCRGGRHVPDPAGE
jgi:hypothetical protein